MNIVSQYTISGWFLCTYSRFKYVYFLKIRYGWQYLGKFRPVKIDPYVIVGINMFIFLSNQKYSLCHGINYGSYEIGTLANVVHWEMNAIAPYGFIVEECNRVVNTMYKQVSHTSTLYTWWWLCVLSFVENGLFCNPRIATHIIKDKYRLTKTNSRWFLCTYSRFK